MGLTEEDKLRFEKIEKNIKSIKAQLKKMKKPKVEKPKADKPESLTD